MSEAEINEAKRLFDPLEQARTLKALMERYGFSQEDLSNLLKNVSQAQISRLLSLLTLEPEFQERIDEGTLRQSTAFELAKLPEEERLKFLGRENIRLKEVIQRRRNLRQRVVET